MNKFIKKMTFFLLLAVSFVGINCGYTTKSSLPSNLRVVTVEPFENEINYSTAKERKTYFPLLEVKVRDEVINRFQFDGNLKIGQAEDADLILKGTLLDYQREPLRYADNDTVEEYRVKVIVSLELFDTAKQENMWVETRFIGDDTYFETGSLATTEESAVQAAVEDLARRIVERTIENW
jgi:hypothetical protein